MNLKIAAKTSHNFVFRPATERDVPALMSLFEQCFEERPSEKYIRWRYFRTPAGTAPAMLAFDGDICAASIMVWPQRMMLGGKEILAGELSDVMTHPAYRNRGLFVLLAEKCREYVTRRGYSFFFAFPTDTSVAIARRRLNWDHVCDVPRWVRPLWFLGTSRLSGLAATISLLWSPPSSKGLTLVEEAPEPGAVSVLAAHYEQSRGTCRIKRSREWFSWRYHADSDRNYQWVAAFDGAELKGAGVWRYDPKTRRVYVCELIGDARSIPAVLDVVLRAAHRQKARAVDFPTNDLRLIPLLKSKGFMGRPGHHLIVRSFNDNTMPANIHWAEAWRLYGGDIDYF